MTITLSSSQLLDLLQIANRLTSGSKQHSVGMTLSVLFEVKGEELQLIAADDDTRLVMTMPIESVKGEVIPFCIRPEQLLEPLKEVPAQNITMSLNPDLENQNINVSYQGGYFNFMYTPGQNFPVAHRMGGMKFDLDLSVDQLLQGIDLSVYAASADDSRPLVTGVHIDARPEHLTFVSTDGFLLAMCRNSNIHHTPSTGSSTEGDAGTQVLGKDTFTMPRKIVLLVRAFLQKKEESPIKIKIYENMGEIICDGLEMQFRLLDGKYPNYESVIPTMNDKELEADRELLLSAVRRVSIFANEALDLINLQMTSTELTITARDTDFSANSEEKIPVSFSGSEPMSIGVKSLHLKNALQSLSSQNVLLKLGDSARPMLIKPVEMEDGVDALAAVMPMV